MVEHKTVIIFNKIFLVVEIPFIPSWVLVGIQFNIYSSVIFENKYIVNQIKVAQVLIGIKVRFFQSLVQQ